MISCRGSQCVLTLTEEEFVLVSNALLETQVYEEAGVEEQLGISEAKAWSIFDKLKNARSAASNRRNEQIVELEMYPQQARLLVESIRTSLRFVEEWEYQSQTGFYVGEARAILEELDALVGPST